MLKPFPYKINYFLEYKLKSLVQLLEQDDVWIIIDGDEGSGKTNMAAYILYWFHCMTGRSWYTDASNFYFDTDDLVNWAKSQSNQLINWDEAALGGLSTEWWSHSQRNLIKFAMTGRKRHHVFVLCIPKAIKLVEYLREDRSHALIHMHTGKTKKDKGHYMYLTRRGKRMLFHLWKQKKIRAYKKYASMRFGGHYGYIPYILPELINIDAYDDKKDNAILGIGHKKTSKEHMQLVELRKKVADMDIKREELAKKLGLSTRTLRNWANPLGKSDLEAGNAAI